MSGSWGGLTSTQGRPSLPCLTPPPPPAPPSHHLRHSPCAGQGLHTRLQPTRSQWAGRGLQGSGPVDAWPRTNRFKASSLTSWIQEAKNSRSPQVETICYFKGKGSRSCILKRLTFQELYMPLQWQPGRKGHLRWPRPTLSSIPSEGWEGLRACRPGGASGTRQRLRWPPCQPNFQRVTEQGPPGGKAAPTAHLSEGSQPDLTEACRQPLSLGPGGDALLHPHPHWSWRASLCKSKAVRSERCSEWCRPSEGSSGRQSGPLQTGNRPDASTHSPAPFPIGSQVLPDPTDIFFLLLTYSL